VISLILDRRYKIISSLSAGGFGHTYLAEDTKRPGNPICVVKQLRPPTQDPNTIKIARDLFAKEAETLEKLGQYPQIPRLFAYFEQQQEFYLVQEFIPGSTLAEEIQVGHPGNEEKVRQLLIAVLEILTFVHGQGVIHRDIKPANLIRRQSDDKLVLIDFGAVKELATQTVNSQGQMTSTVAIGTRGYMPLEQLNGYPQYSSDIYAVGIMGIQALTGLGINDLLKLKDPNNPSTGEIIWRDRAQVSSEFAATIDRMVRVDYRQRYQTAADALTVLQDTVKIATRQPSSLPTKQSVNVAQRLRQLPKRIWLTVASGLAVVLLSGLGIASWQNHQKNAQASVLLEQARAKINREDYGAASSDLNQVLQIQPQNGEAYFWRAYSHSKSFDLDSTKKAIADYTQALRYLKPLTPQVGIQFSIDSNTKQPIITDVPYKLPAAQAGVRQSDRILAIDNQLTVNKTDTQIQKMLQGEANTPVTLRLARQGTRDFEVTCNRVMAPNQQLAIIYGYRSFARWQDKDYAGALQDARKAQEIVPGSKSTGLFHYYEGLALAGQGKKQDALYAYRTAITKEPKLEKPYIKQGEILRQLNKPLEAVEVYNQAIQVNPNFVEAYSERGETRFNYLGQKQAAIADFTKIIQLRPQVRSILEPNYLANAYFQRGRAYLDLGKPQDAIADFNWLLNQKPLPTKDLPYIFRGVAKDKLKDFQGAIADFTKVIDDDSYSRYKQEAYHFRGLTYVHIKNIPGAIQDFTKAIEVTEDAIKKAKFSRFPELLDEYDPKAYLPSYYMSRGRAYANLGYKQQAIEDLQKAAQLAFEQKQLDRYTTANTEIQKLR
jgi:serine/threonine protein kinase